MTDIKYVSAIEFNPSGQRIAIGCMDGTWWVDWDQVATWAAKEVSNDDASSAAMIMFARLLTEAKGSFQEVTRERAEEIALEAGAYTRPAEQTSKAPEPSEEDDPRAEYLQFVKDRRRAENR